MGIELGIFHRLVDFGILWGLFSFFPQGFHIRLNRRSQYE